MNIYIGNLSYNISENDLQKAFEEFGQVESAKIIVDKFTGRSKGFAFVEMTNDDDGKKAISAMDGKDLDGRAAKVNEAKPRNTEYGGDRGGNRRNNW